MSKHSVFATHFPHIAAAFFFICHELLLLVNLYVCQWDLEIPNLKYKKALVTFYNLEFKQ